jgi:hypothetical protein
MIRSWVPSLLGLTPRSESRIAFSIAASCVLSYGLMMAIRGSGVPIEAIWVRGVGLP